MNVKQKARIYSQQPHSSTQNREKSRANNEVKLFRTPSYHDEQIIPRRNTAKLAYISKLTEKYGLASKEMQTNKVGFSQAMEEAKLKHFSKGLSQHKFKSGTVNPIANEYPTFQTNALLPEKDSELIQIKLDIKERRRKHKEKRKMIYFTKGNNHQILKEIFLAKFHFTETQVREAARICWLQSISQKESGFISSKSLYDDHLPEIGRNRGESSSTIYNYLEGESELTNKERLYRNMKKYYPESIGNYIPKSFIIDFKQQQSLVEESLLEFVKYYLKKESKRAKIRPIYIKNYFMEINITNKQLSKIVEKFQLEVENTSQEYEETDEKSELAEKEALWILKPTSLNRGRGIHLFSTLKQLSKLLSESSFEISVKMYNDNMSPKSYVIQEYIERPLLIDGYKFDMRVWVFANILKINGKKVLKTYLFKHGYSRLASVRYSFVPEEKEGEKPPQEKGDQKVSPKKQKKAYINNRFIHLTNNAVQKQAKEYGQVCEGNQLSIEQTVKHFQQRDPTCPLTFETVLQKMKKIVFESASSVRERIASRNIAKTFQLFGYDFLLDEDYNMWLIEVNCNPCLEESSQLLGSLLRTMLSGLVVLTDLEDPKSEAKAEGWLQII